MSGVNTQSAIAESKLVKQSFPVLEMSCASCAISVESILKATPGVKDAAVNFANHSALVTYDTRSVAPIKLQEAVRSIGYDLVVDTEDPQRIQKEAQHEQLTSIKQRTIGAALLTIPVVILGMFFMDQPYSKWISLILSTPVIFFFGRNFFVNAWKQASHGKTNMDTLVALSTGIAFLFSVFNTLFPEFWHSRGLHPHVYYESACVIIVFISLGKFLEEKAKSTTSFALKKLMGLRPKTTRVIFSGREEELPIAALRPGHIILVRPGERIAVDGVVTSGSSFVDESTISGEPVPVEKKPGEKVFEGTINQKGSFQLEAQKVGSNTVLATIIAAVQQAQGSKAPVQRLVDKIAGIFVPVVILTSILTFMVWMVAGGPNAITHALLASITVLVIACPCALGLATPTAIMVGIGKGAENNILIRDAESLETAHRVNIVVLDKTGTITEGKPAVTDMIWDTQKDLELLKSILYTLEVLSEHPLAEAVTVKLKDDNVQQITIEFFESITGRGVKGKFNGRMFYVGNRKLMDENNIAISQQLEEKSNQVREQVKTVVYFSDDHHVLAIIAIADKIKSSSGEAIRHLQQQGIEVHLVTGDHIQTARAVAKQTGITHYKAEVLPGDKAAFIQQLQSADPGKNIVAMVGDGINDSQALAQADVSIAMGKGSDIAIDVAKITLTTSDLLAIPKALTLSSLTVRGIHQNLFWAFIYNLVGIPVAAGVLYPINGFLLNPMIAGAAMALSSVSVVANSLRLRAAKI